MYRLDSKSLREGLLRGEFTAREIVESYLGRIKEMEPSINAFITLMEDEALKAAEKIDTKIKNNEELGALAGSVISIKDNISVEDVKMTCASKMLEDYIAPYSATLVEKILAEDGIIIGKVNMDEFAMGSSTKTSHYGVTRNPIDTNLVSGGSSGGSAASVAAFESTMSVGTDTGGSVRQPASFCSVVGIKPSYGTISRYGVASMANTFDQPGVLGRSVKDATTLLKVLEGRDVKDATSTGNLSIRDLKIDDDFSLEGIKIAVPDIFTEAQVTDVVRDEFNRAIEILKGLGATVSTVKMDVLKLGIETYHILVNGEIAPNLERLDGIIYGHRAEDFSDIDDMYVKNRSEGFGEEVKRRIMIGTHILSLDLAEDYYYKALKVRTLIINEFKNVYKDYDLVISPVSPILPFEVSRDMSPVEIYSMDLFTVCVNIAGLGAMSVPMKPGEISVGIQFICDNFKEDVMINVGRAFERGVK